MTYDVYKQAFDLAIAQDQLWYSTVGLAAVVGIVALIGVVTTYGKLSITFSVLGVAGLITVFVFHGLGLHSLDQKQDQEIARFGSWVDKNYNLSLSKKEMKEMYKGELIKEHDGQLQKLTLEKYQGGVVIMNDGKAIKQK